MLKRRTPSPRQIAASRANGKKSRGPLASSSSALLRFDSAGCKRLARMVLLQGESETKFINLAKQIHDELSPASQIEHMLATKVLLAFWRQMRAWSLERATIARAAASNPDVTSEERGCLGIEALSAQGRFTISEYEARFDRQFARALSAFQRYRAAQSAQKLFSGMPNLGTTEKQDTSPLPEPEK